MELTAPKAVLTPRDYLAILPPAVSGSHGSDVTFHAACALVRFGLSDTEAMNLLRDYSSRCDPPWSEKELAHKLAHARRQPDAPKATRHETKPAERVVWTVTRKVSQNSVEPLQNSVKANTPAPPVCQKSDKRETAPKGLPKSSNLFTTADLDAALKDWPLCYCHRCEAARNQPMP